MKIIHCPECGIEFGVPDAFDNGRREDKRVFYCPNQHQMIYKKSKAEELQEKLTAQEGATARERFNRELAERQRDAAERKLTRTTKRLTRIEKRIAKGIYPCCDRRFENLAQHMCEVHPEFVGENPNLMRGIKGLLPERGSVS